MRPGARTPEELETLLEDAFVTRDREALAQLFDDAAAFAARGDVPARGPDDIAHAATAIWDGGSTYVAEPRRVVQAGDTALVVADRSLSVMRRGGDRCWRYAIALLELDDPTTKEQS